MRTILKHAAAVAAMLFCAGAAAAPMVDVHGGEIRAEPKVQRELSTRGLAVARALRASHVDTVALAAPAIPKLQAASKTTPLQVGFGRPVAELADDASFRAHLHWQRLADETHVAGVRVTSPGAASLRAALLPVSLPDEATVRFQGSGDAAVFEVSGADVNAAIARNRAAGETGRDAAMYWSPLLTGDTVSIEVQLPPDVDPESARLAVPQLSHLVTSAEKNFAVLEKSAVCEVDAMCLGSSWTPEMNAVARMLFSSGGSTYLCTGTLLADQDASSAVPYFLSAAHCISTQSAASSLTTFWFYRSTACNGSTLANSVQLGGGATLLYASSGADSTYTDTSFMRLVNLPPAGAVYAGWSTALASSATAVTGLHHPGGDWLKASTGSITGYWRCTAPGSSGFSCSASSPSGFYSAGWTSGVTEPGSSGSGLFRSDGTLIGQLYGGSGTCTTPGDDIYGRFDLAYTTALKQWLASQPLNVSRTGAGSGTVASAPAGIACGTTCSASFASGSAVTLTATPAAGSVFTGWSGACTGTASCALSMNGPASVTASFAVSTTALSVSVSGSGRVASSPAGIDCGSTCSAAFTSGSAVTLSATPAAGMVFQGWSGACTGTGACTVTMDGAKSIAAAFVPATADLAITQAVAPSVLVAGKDAVITLHVANAGPAPATSVTVTHTLPAGWSLVWLAPACWSSGSTLFCSSSSIAAGASQDFQVVARPAVSGGGTLTADVSGTEPDPSTTDNASSLAVSVDAAATANLVPRYRLYSPISLEHHFTTDLNEYNVLGASGAWVQEGSVGKVLDGPGTFNGVTATPYYRLYNTFTRWHHWTTDANEYYTLVTYPGWNGEGVDGYILPSATTGAMQLFRLVYPNGTGLHHWTVDPNEYATLIAVYGWVGEGGAGFVIQ